MVTTAGQHGQSGTFRHPPQQKRKRNNLNRGIYRLGQLLKGASILVAIAVSWVNIQPFLAFVLWAFPAPESEPVQFVLGLPYIGEFLESAGGLIAMVAAVAIWGVVILIEIMPEMIKLRQADLQQIINEYQSHDSERIEARDEDPSVIKALVDWHNNLPVQWVKDIFAAQGMAFLVDFIVSFIYYYPLKVDLQVFMAAPSFEDVNALQAVLVVLCVGTATVIVHVIRIADGGSRTFRGEK